MEGPIDLEITNSAGEIIHPYIPIESEPYRLTGILGSGGVGTIFLAQPKKEKPAIEEFKTLKKIHPFITDEIFDILKNSHMVRTQAGGDLDDFVSPRFDLDLLRKFRLLTARYEHGRTLSDTARLLTSFDQKILFYIAVYRALVRGIGILQRKNLVHNDVKPDNIIVLAPPHNGVRLLDGDALSEVGDSFPGKWGGTPAYCAPEIAREEGSTISSDLFSAAFVTIEKLYEVFCPRELYHQVFNPEDHSSWINIKRRREFFTPKHAKNVLYYWGSLPKNIKQETYGSFLHLIAAMSDDPAARPQSLEESEQLLAEKPPMEI